MKYFFLFLILLACVGAYLRIQQPALWNAGITALENGNDSAPPAPSVASQPPTSNAPPSVPAPPPEPTPSKTLPTIITPDAVYINPDHVKPVEQPTQAPDTNAAPVAPAPAPATTPEVPAPSVPAAPTTNAVVNPAGP